MFASQVNETPGTARRAGSTGSVGAKLAALLGRMISTVSVRRRERRLRLCEMLPLGEKRFVAVIEYGPQKFLLAGTPQNISLLRHLDANLDANLDAANAPRSAAADAE